MTMEKQIDLLRCALLQLAFSQPEPIAAWLSWPETLNSTQLLPLGR